MISGKIADISLVIRQVANERNISTQKVSFEEHHDHLSVKCILIVNEK